MSRITLVLKVKPFPPVYWLKQNSVAYAIANTPQSMLFVCCWTVGKLTGITTPIYRLRTNTGKFWKMDIFTSDDTRDTAFRAGSPYRSRPLGSFSRFFWCSSNWCRERLRKWRLWCKTFCFHCSWIIWTLKALCGWDIAGTRKINDNKTW
jgi:hypothetical protein